MSKNRCVTYHFTADEIKAILIREVPREPEQNVVISVRIENLGIFAGEPKLTGVDITVKDSQ